jgi:hypothetical protein
LLSVSILFFHKPSTFYLSIPHRFLRRIGFQFGVRDPETMVAEMPDSLATSAHFSVQQLLVFANPLTGETKTRRGLKPARKTIRHFPRPVLQTVAFQMQQVETLFAVRLAAVFARNFGLRFRTLHALYHVPVDQRKKCLKEYMFERVILKE